MNTALHPGLADGGAFEPGRDLFDNSSPLPDTTSCRVKFLNMELAECLAERPASCPFVVAFGNGYYCWHPHRLEIASRSRAASQPMKSV